ncbi:MAG: LLM class F420-dependent oxidoreductase [Dehalococcoidia bacterium]
MQYGVVFPQTEIGADPGAVRDFSQAAEGLGYSGLLAYDHVVGADPRRYPGWSGAYALQDLFHEPFVLFGYLAGVTRRIQLVTGIVILPQRQTALVAKQAAEVDVLSQGRLCLGIGIGWNQVEFEALGEEFHNRGARCEEQVALLRALWTQEVVDFQGRWHRVSGAGLNPLPVQRPIPVWIGGSAEPVLKRAGRIGDGWFPQVMPDAHGKAAVERVRDYAREAGRDPSHIGIGARIKVAGNSTDSLLAEVGEWQRLGASHIYLDTMKAGLGSPQQHIDAIEAFKTAVEGLPCA